MVPIFATNFSHRYDWERLNFNQFTNLFRIDEVKVSKIPNEDRTKRVMLNTLKLGQLRDDGEKIENERLEIRWSHGGQERPEFDDRFEIDAEGGVWSVGVRFFTPEVRYDPNGLLQDIENFTVTFQANSTVIDMP